MLSESDGSQICQWKSQTVLPKRQHCRMFNNWVGSGDQLKTSWSGRVGSGHEFKLLNQFLSVEHCDIKNFKLNVFDFTENKQLYK